MGREAGVDGEGGGGEGGGGREKEGGGTIPTDNNALLIDVRLSSDAEIFVVKRRLDMQVGAKRARNVHATRTCSN